MPVNSKVLDFGPWTQVLGPCPWRLTPCHWATSLC